MKKLLIPAFVALILLASVTLASPQHSRIYVKGDTPDYLIESLNGKVIHKFGEVKSVVVSEPSKNVLKSLGYYVKDVPVFHIKGDIARDPKAGLCFFPSDKQPWGIKKIKAPAVWATGNKGQNTVVAILDTGIRKTHQDLKAVPLVYCKDEVTNTTGSCGDDNGHGTHVSGTVAAQGVRIFGVSPGVSLMMLKVCDSNGDCPDDAIGQGIEDARLNGATIISMSLGGSTPLTPAAEQKLIDAYNANIVIVAASGNSGPAADTIEYPGAYPQVISVGATNNRDSVASFSSRGSTSPTCLATNGEDPRCLEVAAPGVTVISAYYSSDTSYACMDGTSMATPHTAATAALVKSAFPALTVEEVRQRIHYGFDITKGSNAASGYDIAGGTGLIKADKATS